MNKEFIPYEQALELKELGFLQDDTTCRCVQNEGFEEEKLGWGILYQQAFRWFREKYEMTYSINGAKDYVKVSIDAQEYGWYGEIDGSYNSYEEAELACLKKLIEIVKKK